MASEHTLDPFGHSLEAVRMLMQKNLSQAETVTRRPKSRSDKVILPSFSTTVFENTVRIQTPIHSKSTE